MTSDQVNGKLDQTFSDRNATSANIARQIYDPANANWSWNSISHSQDTASAHLPQFGLDHGSNEQSEFSSRHNGASSNHDEESFRQWGPHHFGAGSHDSGDDPAWSGRHWSNGSGDATSTSASSPPAEVSPPAITTPESTPPAEVSPPAATTPAPPAEVSPPAATTPAPPAEVSPPAATNPGPPVEVSPPATTTSGGTAAGALTVQNGQLMENGQPFTPGGLAANPSDVVNNPNFIQTLIGSGANQFNSNFIRLAMDPSDTATQTVQAAQQIEAAAQAAGKPVVVEIEQHITNGETLTGSALSQSEALYSQMAGQTKGDSNIIYGTPNEPSPDGSPTQEQDYVNEQTGIIGAIRGAGNSTAVMIEGGSWSNPLGNNWLQQNASTFEQAAGGNAIGDLHIYVNNSAQVAPIESVISQLTQAGMPSIVGEYGNAPSGTPTVPNSPELVYQIQKDTGVGNVGWELFPVGSPENSETSTQGYGDVLYNGSGATQLNQYGVQILQHLNPSGVTAADENAPAVGA
jgi:Cellulase (glycosyl hydrolase family 5)